MTTITREEAWGSISYDSETDEFSALVRGQNAPIPSAPIGIGWVIIGTCNEECLICYGNAEELPSKKLSTAKCLQVVDLLREANILRVVISGGEPLLHPGTIEVIEKLHSLGISVVLGTNGTYVSSKNVGTLSKCTRVEISIDGATLGTNNVLRPSRKKRGNSWTESWNAIDLCLSHAVRVRVLTTLTSSNEHDILGLAELLYKRGVRDWAISWTIPAGRARNNYEALRPRGESIDRDIDAVRRLYPSMKIRYSQRGVDFSRFYFLILPDGQIATEDLALGKKVTFGLIHNTPIRSAWSNANFSISTHFDKWVGDRITHLV